MNKAFLGFLAVVILFPAITRAAQPPSAASTRCALYRQEVRAALVKRGWNITQDETGKLTAQRPIIQSGPTGIIGSDNSFARLMIDLQADGGHHTIAAARASLLVYQPRSSSEVGILVYPPLALRDPKLTREYLDVLAEAEVQLAADHPACAAADAHLPEVKSDSRRFALK